MATCFFVSDLHGNTDRYETLFHLMVTERPVAVFLGGDLLPSHLDALSSDNWSVSDFVTDYLLPGFSRIQRSLANASPRVFLILGNDDPRSQESTLEEAESKGVWQYIHGKKVILGDNMVFGYSFVPPTPFLLKDWERYDVSMCADPGCIHPTEGYRSVPMQTSTIKHSTIKADLIRLAGEDDLSTALFLFHSPPYNTLLDRAALDGRFIDHVPVDVHVGSIAIRQFIESRQPLLTLHGHVHESARITGSWKDRIGKTWILSAAHDGPELALVRFDLKHPELAVRELL